MLSPGTRVWIRSSPSPSPAMEDTSLRSTSSRRSSSMAASSDSECSDPTCSSLTNRRPWTWKIAYCLQATAKEIQLRLPGEDPQDVLTLPASAWETQDILMANDYSQTDVHVDTHTNAHTTTPTDQLHIPQDLISLTHLHEPAVVECLEHRFHQDTIYTFTGPVLLALNPFQTVRGLYGESMLKKYFDSSSASKPPHVYAIANAAFDNMMRHMHDAVEHCCDDSNERQRLLHQSILVSGESGAGKTVTTKYVMKYLAALSQRAHATTKKQQTRAYLQVKEQFNGTQDQPQQPPSSIEAQVLQSNPILESFGNARTVRNDNSSRFGKFMQLQFTSTGTLVGATLQTYLLEKVRLVHPSLGERNYHIFYELLQGASAGELRQYCLATTAAPDDFLILHSGTYDRRDGVTDVETYKALQRALQTMKFTNRQIKDIYSTAASLLHLGNLTFLAGTNDEAQLDETNVHLKPVCHLLGLDAAHLNRALCSCEIRAGKDGVQRALRLPQAYKGLEALLKATYAALFQYLVQRINDSIAQTESTTAMATIGVLDIFGFESFQTNSFEQLCINYCNEALQQQFNAFVLKNEQAEYEKEGIEWSFIEFPENQDVLDLIASKRSGILVLLDDQCRAPGTTDKSFALNVYSQCQSHVRFTTTSKQTAQLQFSIRHYAGPVEYTVQGFVEKNRDELPKETAELLLSSRNPFVQVLADLVQGSNGRLSAGLDSASSVSRGTVGGQFRRQLKDLRNKIDSTTPHYIRCLKPNDMLVPDHFDPSVVAEQLRCGGILEAVRVARAGFTQHYPHADFYKRYRALASQDLSSSTATSATTTTWGGGLSTPSWSTPAAVTKRWEPPRQSAYGCFSSSPRSSSKVSATPEQQQQQQVDYKAQCKKLLKVIHRKFSSWDEDPNSTSSTPSTTPEPTKAKSYSYTPTSPPPAWTRGGNKTPSPTATVQSRSAMWERRKQQPDADATPPPPKPVYRNRGSSTADWAKLGIQLGKTKVFLRHKAFETLERVRSRILTKSATLLNSVFRMYLARVAYLQVRAAFRQELCHLYSEDHKETKEPDYGDHGSPRTRHVVVRLNDFSYAGETPGDFFSHVRMSIHNPVPRNEWGKAAPGGAFKWVLEEGIWVKNPVLVGENAAADC